MKRFAIGLLIALVLLCGIGTYGLRKFNEIKAANEAAKLATAKVEKGDLVVEVIETGTIDAVKAVEVKSRASGRLAKLLVEEGDQVKQGQLIAVIDPKETQLKVEQDRAQLRGAKSGVDRLAIEIEQRRTVSKAAYHQAKNRVEQLERELKIQPTLTSSAIASAEAALASAKKERERLATSAHPIARVSAENAVREATANHEQAQRELARQEELVRQGYVPGKSVENAKLSLDLAKVRLDQTKDNLSRLDTQQQLELARSTEDIKRAEADLARAKANSVQDAGKRNEYESALDDLKKAEASLRDVEALQRSREQSLATVSQIESVLSESERQLGETEIRAPLDGVVSRKLVQEGELVASLSSFSSGTAIVRIEDRRTLMVKLNINEIDTARLKVGMKARINVDALPEDQFSGEVKKIAPTSTVVQGASDSVVKYAVEIWVDGSNPKLRTGMSAKCTLEVERRNGVLNLPAEYVGQDEKGESFVELPPKSKDKDAKPERVTVKTGLSTGARIQILSGVAEGTTVQRPPFTGPKRKGFMQAGPDDE